jgi:hypothetical protein
MALGRAFGISKFTMPDVEYADMLKDYERRMREFPEYLLPLAFFPPGSVEDNSRER